MGRRQLILDSIGERQRIVAHHVSCSNAALPEQIVKTVPLYHAWGLGVIPRKVFGEIIRIPYDQWTAINPRYHVDRCCCGNATPLSVDTVELRIGAQSCDVIDDVSMRRIEEQMRISARVWTATTSILVRRQIHRPGSIWCNERLITY